MTTPLALLQLRALVRNDEALLAHLAERIEATTTVDEASPLLARWHAVGERLRARRELLRSEVSLFVTGHHQPAAPHSCHGAPVTRAAAQPASLSPTS